MTRLAAHVWLYFAELGCALLNHAFGCFCQNNRITHWAWMTTCPPEMGPVEPKVRCPSCDMPHDLSDAEWLQRPSLADLRAMGRDSGPGTVTTYTSSSAPVTWVTLP